MEPLEAINLDTSFLLRPLPHLEDECVFVVSDGYIRNVWICIWYEARGKRFLRWEGFLPRDGSVVYRTPPVWRELVGDHLAESLTIKQYPEDGDDAFHVECHQTRPDTMGIEEILECAVPEFPKAEEIRSCLHINTRLTVRRI